MNLARRVLAGLLGVQPKPEPTPILGSYLTLGGAQVHVTADSHPSNQHTRRWTCTGCGHTETGTESLAGHNANDHAGTCRAMPAPGGAR